jgi:rhodanese-related sulfurtransferase
MLDAHRQFKDTVYDQLARMSKALAAPKRLELLDLLCQGPRTVEALAEQAALSVANASKHLQILRAARLLDAEKHGLYVEYRLADDDVCQLFLLLRRLGESRLAELDQVLRSYFAGKEVMDPVESKELLRRVRSGEVTVLDVRPVEEYDAGHLSGAVSIPVPELEARLRELPRDREVIAYCRGPFCVMAVQAVDLLREKGFRAQRLEFGIAEFRERGWRVTPSQALKLPKSANATQPANAAKPAKPSRTQGAHS